MNINLPGSQQVFSTKVNEQFKAQIAEAKSGKVIQENELVVGGKTHSVKLAETSPQAEAVGKGKLSSWMTSVKNSLSEIVAKIIDSVKSLVKQDKTVDSVKETMSPQEKANAASAQNKAILAFVSGNEEILKTVGFTRVNGDAAKVSNLTKSATTSLEGISDVPLLASAFKMNIRNNLAAEDAAIISSMVDTMINSEGRELPALEALPEIAQDAIKLGKQIAEYSHENKMDAKNLGIVFGPNFLPSDVPPSEILSRNGELSNFFEKMIAS